MFSGINYHWLGGAPTLVKPTFPGLASGRDIGSAARRLIGNCSPGWNPRAIIEVRLLRFARCASAWNRSAQCWRERAR
jgi:hypothetical protein